MTNSEQIITGAVGTGLSAIGTATQTSEVLQIISLIITIIGGVITFIVIPILNWYSKAKKDGKLTTEEIKEGVNVVATGIEKLNDSLNDKTKTEEKK